MTLAIYIIDGQKFSDLESFFTEVNKTLIPDVSWAGKNYSAFNDIIGVGGCFVEDEFILIWNNSEKSKIDLGYPYDKEMTVFELLLDIIYDNKNVTLILN